MQSVCREVLEKLDRFRYPSEAGFKQWLYATALRKIRDRYDYYLAAKRDVRLEARPTASASGEPGDLAQFYRTMVTPSRAASAAEEIERIEQAFDRLPEHYREVLVQARLLGLSRAEIGEARGLSENAVGALLFRASAKLAGLLDEPPRVRARVRRRRSGQAVLQGLGARRGSGCWPRRPSPRDRRDSPQLHRKGQPEGEHDDVAQLAVLRRRRPRRPRGTTRACSCPGSGWRWGGLSGVISESRIPVR